MDFGSAQRYERSRCRNVKAREKTGGGLKRNREENQENREKALTKPGGYATISTPQKGFFFLRPFHVEGGWAIRVKETS